MTSGMVKSIKDWVIRSQVLNIKIKIFIYMDAVQRLDVGGRYFLLKIIF